MDEKEQLKTYGITPGTTRVLHIYYTLDNARTHKIDVYDPKDDLTLTQVTTAAQSLITNDFLLISGSHLSAATFDKAYVEETTITELSDI